MTASAKEVIAAAIPAAMKAGDVGGMSFVFDEGEGYVTIDGSFLGADVATAILAALDAAGYVVVPREPTDAMITAVGSIDFPYRDIFGDMSVSKKYEAGTEIYSAMIAAQESKS